METTDCTCAISQPSEKALTWGGRGASQEVGQGWGGVGAGRRVLSLASVCPDSWNVLNHPQTWADRNSQMCFPFWSKPCLSISGLWKGRFPASQRSLAWPFPWGFLRAVPEEGGCTQSLADRGRGDQDQRGLGSSQKL